MTHSNFPSAYENNTSNSIQQVLLQAWCHKKKKKTNLTLTEFSGICSLIYCAGIGSMKIIGNDVAYLLLIGKERCKLDCNLFTQSKSNMGLVACSWISITLESKAEQSWTLAYLVLYCEFKIYTGCTSYFKKEKWQLINEEKTNVLSPMLLFFICAWGMAVHSSMEMLSVPTPSKENETLSPLEVTKCQ